MSDLLLLSAMFLDMMTFFSFWTPGESQTSHWGLHPLEKP